VKGGTSNIVTKFFTTDTDSAKESKKYAYRNNYKGKIPMTHTQWRRYQRSKKGTNDKAVDPKGKEIIVETIKRPVEERLSLPHVEEKTVGFRLHGLRTKFQCRMRCSFRFTCRVWRGVSGRRIIRLQYRRH